MIKRLTYSKGIYGDEEKQAVMRSLDSGRLSNGVETMMFEYEFARWWGINFALSTSSGSTADFVALQSLNLPRGSEVITTPGATFPTTVTAMIYLGLIPVFVDVDGIVIDANKIKKAISKKTKAIMFAHTLGTMPNMTKIMEVVNRYELKLIEDACDSVGSQQNGKRAGTFGNSATVSFYPAHHMTTGEGGMMITNSRSIFREASSIRDWGRDCVCQFNDSTPVCGSRFKNPPFDHRYYYTRIGSNFKMSEMQAAFGREQLKRLDGFIHSRKRNYKILAGILNEPYNNDISPFAYPLFSKDKEKEMLFLNSCGIDTRVLFAGNILRHPAFKNIDCRVVGEMTQSDRVLNEAYFVGIGPHLTTNDMVFIGDKICQARKLL